MRVLSEGPDPDLHMRTSGDDRKPGLHLSDITKRIIFEKDKKLNPNSPIDAMVLERGFTWETVLETALAARHTRPGYRPEQFQEDGIWCSPDWITGDGKLEEWKATKKSSKRGFADVSWHWMPNSMAYLRGLLKREMVFAPVVRFRIWWMNGDYSYESKNSDWHLLNDYWKVDVEFSRRELDENWTAILNAGVKYGLLKETPTWASKAEQSQKQNPQAKKRSGLQPPSGSRVITFPSSRKKNRSDPVS